MHFTAVCMICAFTVHTVVQHRYYNNAALNDRINTTDVV
jgi:hypothetical protein